MAASPKCFTRATEAEYICPLCGETDIRRPGRPAPICEECGAEMEFFDGPDERALKAAAFLSDGEPEDL